MSARRPANGPRALRRTIACDPCGARGAGAPPGGLLGLGSIHLLERGEKGGPHRKKRACRNASDAADDQQQDAQRSAGAERGNHEPFGLVFFKRRHPTAPRDHEKGQAYPAERLAHGSDGGQNGALRMPNANEDRPHHRRPQAEKPGRRAEQQGKAREGDREGDACHRQGALHELPHPHIAPQRLAGDPQSREEKRVVAPRHEQGEPHGLRPMLRENARGHAGEGRFRPTAPNGPLAGTALTRSEQSVPTRHKQPPQAPTSPSSPPCGQHSTIRLRRKTHKGP